MQITYICAVRSKWYIEFSIVLVMILVAIVCVLNIDFTSTSRSPLPKGDVTNTTVPEKPNPDKAKWLAGRDVFRANCAGCHNPTFDGVGPCLKGATIRWKAAGSYQGKTGDQWMKMWIRNWHDVVNAGYKYGIDLKNSRPAQMNIFVGMTDEKIDNIMFYVDSPDLGKSTAAK
jgi:hypothetical protein